MKARFNWAVWAGFVLAIFALLSFPLLFVRFPITRDFPWANLILFAMAMVLLVIGVKRAFAPGRGRVSKIGASVLATLGVVVLALFVFGVFVMARWLPASKAAPQVGQRVPEFNLTDQTGKQVSLADLLTAPINGKAPQGVLLVFYRGYW